MNKNTYTVLCMMILSVVIAFSGTHYWDDGEIVRGPKINVALDEKMDVADAAFFQLSPTTGFATSGADIGTVYMNASGEINYLSTGTTWMKLLATTTGLQY